MSGLRKPWVLIALLGAVLVTAIIVVARWDLGARRVVVSAEQQAQLAFAFREAQRRPPTATELQSLVRHHVLQELGIDPAAGEERREPTEAELQDYWDVHAARYRPPDLLSFRQYFVAPEGDTDAAARRAADLLSRLSDATATAALPERSAGLLPPVSTNVTSADVTERFGAAFADALEALPLGVWSGPVESRHGLHIVRVDTRIVMPLPRLAEHRAAVIQDWQRDRRRDATERLCSQLADTIDVEVEPLPNPADVLLQ